MMTLADKMRRLADQRPDIREEFTDLADRLDTIPGALEADPINVPRVVGIWAKARRRWCEETGEPLI